MSDDNRRSLYVWSWSGAGCSGLEVELISGTAILLDGLFEAMRLRAVGPNRNTDLDVSIFFSRPLLFLSPRRWIAKL